MATRVGGSDQTGHARQPGGPGADDAAGPVADEATSPSPDEATGPLAGEAASPATDQAIRPGSDDAARPGAGEAAGPGAGQAEWQRTGLLTGALGLRHVPGTGSPWRWAFSGIWLVYLVQPVSGLFGHGHGVLWIAGGLAITIAFSVIYILVLVKCDGRPQLARAGLLAIVLLAFLACVVYGKAWTPLWIYVSAAVGMVLAAEPNGREVAVRGVLAVTACYALCCWISHDDLGDFLIVLLPVLLIGIAMIGFRLQMQLTRDLAQARETVAKLAANEERLRLARDMHDLTGQSLSTITLKSELAAKRMSRLPASAEREAVLGDLGDIGRVSRQTLHDIREAVTGYRRPTLAIEVITARNALDAAGIRLDDDAELTLRSGTFDPDAEAVLAWCLREAVTNVIRHSGARSCRIRLTEHAELSLEVADDGHGFAALDPRAPKGAGLRGMSERLSAVGGRLSLGSADPGRGHGFRLIATVPVDHHDP
jgi:two-component system, NarL family, sensor histidine kinase DesK